MPNEMRDRLVELIKQADKECNRRAVCTGCKAYGKGKGCFFELVADHLIENGVIVPPCKVGDKTFLLLEETNGDYDIVESKCVRITDSGYGKYYSMSINCRAMTLECGICDFGKGVFLTKEEAEQKLKEVRGVE